MNAMALSDLTAWPLLSDKDGKVICPKELVGHNSFNYFGMSDKVLWLVDPNGQTPPMTEDHTVVEITSGVAHQGES